MDNNKRNLEIFNKYKDQVKTASYDLHDLASRMGLKLGKGQKSGDNRLYYSPHHTDSSPSLSIFMNSNGRTGWKDHSTGNAGQDSLSLYQYKYPKDFKEVLYDVGDMYNIPRPDYSAKNADATAPQYQQKSLVDYIASRCLGNARENINAYLLGRGIHQNVIDRAVNKKSLGWNDWTSTKVEKGEIGYGGAGVAAIVRDRDNRQVVAVDTRYQQPDLNGGIKTNSQGEKNNVPWVIDWFAFERATTIVIVESFINALSVESCNMYKTVSLALRGTANAKTIDPTIFEGKQVIIAMDNDKPFADDHQLKGHRPGPEAGWVLYDRLTAANVCCQLVDHLEWEEGEDINDILQNHNAAVLKKRLARLETGVIAGFINDRSGRKYAGKKRLSLPIEDLEKYWRYRIGSDLTRLHTLTKPDKEGETHVYTEDLAGFRVAGIDRIEVQDWKATVYGGRPDLPELMYSVAAQTPHHGRILKRLTMTDEQFSSPTNWAKIGYIYKPAEFMRMTTILTRMINGNERKAMNFIGLGYKEGKPTVNEGDQCFFRFDDQCPYNKLRFQRGSKADARQVIHAFQQTFTGNAAMMAVVWALGAHIKLFTEAWPHMMLAAQKGAGKSVLMNKLSKHLQMQVFGKEQLDTGYRLLTTTSYTSHPVAWEEISTLEPHVLRQANASLQQGYNYRYSTRGNMGNSFLTSAPVLIGGEEVDMDSLIGKMVRMSISFDTQGDEIPLDTPVFPLKNWLDWLSEMKKKHVAVRKEKADQHYLNKARIKPSDANAKRIVKNFAAIGLAWRLLCEFAEIDYTQGGFEDDLVKEMNGYLAETESDRQPWVWILEIILSEIDADKYQYPYTFGVYIDDQQQEHDCLIIRHQQMMNHIRHSMHLRDRWNALPIKKGITFKNQMHDANVILKEDVERKVLNQRYSHMLAISLDRLENYGLTLAVKRTAVA